MESPGQEQHEVPESRSRKKPAYVPPPGKAVSKVNPVWLVPVMVGLMVLGLVWIVTTYLTSTNWPIPNIGSWNLLIGFTLVIVGFGMTTRWQ
jgi:hypothetical protein